MDVLKKNDTMASELQRAIYDFSYNQHQFDENSDFKPRNRLSLADRVRAIQAYEKTPIYQKVGLIFNCSAKQIRNIVKNKHKIMSLYMTGSKGTTRPKNTETLEKALVEWVLRARRNPNVDRLTQEMMHAAALEIKNILRMEKFYPDSAWLNRFRDTFRITDEDMETPLPDGLGPISLNIQDIVDYVREREYADASNFDLDYSSWNDEPETDSNWNDDSLASSSLHVPNSVATTSSRASSSSADDQDSPSKYPKLEPIDVIEIDSDDDDDGGPPDGRKTQRNMPITTVEQALRHLKPLEEFALMKEDFRAIGLISQLEAVLNSAKRKQSSH